MEVVIHDLFISQNSVVYTINNCVAGRKNGGVFDHLVKQVLLSKNFEGDYVASYMIVTEDGKQIKSSIVLIRNSKIKVIGGLCINYNLECMKNMKDFFIVEKDIEYFEYLMEFGR